MSAEPYDADPAVMPQAHAAVDILPAQAGRKPRHPEPDPVDAQVPSDPAWDQPTVAVNPWADPVGPTAAGPVVPMHTGSIPASVPVPVFPGASVPGLEPVDGAGPVSDPQQPTAKRFLGMQLRRPRRADGSPADEAESLPAGPPVPVAAWPTDVGLPVIADAEPATPAPWGPPVGYAVSDSGHDAADTIPAQAPESYSWDVQPPSAPTVGTAPVEVAEQVPPVPAAPSDLPTALPVPVPVPVASGDEEVRALRTLLDASEARRSEAEQRADHAVAYAQQLQADLTRVQSELEAKLQATEVRVRTAANEAQDWQIRHREAQTQITELAASLAGAEQRLADVRTERDDLMSQLEEATSPDRDAVAQQLEG